MRVESDLSEYLRKRRIWSVSAGSFKDMNSSKR